MASSYFKNFPTIVYNDVLATNIMARIKMDALVRDKTSVFYPYTISEGERPDTIAAHYYEDPKFSWLIYFANEIIDPYFEWPLNYNELLNFIINKYGSVSKAQERILFFKNNWESDESMLSTGSYDSLPGLLKKYWRPVFNYKGIISSYQRAESDAVVETNFTIEITHDGDLPFIIGDIVKQGSDASGIVKAVASGLIVVEKIQGEFTKNTLTDYEETTTVSVTDTVTLNQAIPDNELIYWSPVTAYDYEEQLNEQKKIIYIVDKSYLNQIELEMKSLMV